jgi:hypothetical protein
MISDPNYICPLCGLVLPSLADYHAHFAREHRRGAAAAGEREREVSYSNGCPVIEEEGF